MRPPSSCASVLAVLSALAAGCDGAALTLDAPPHVDDAEAARDDDLPGFPAPVPCPPEEAWPDGMACVHGGSFTLGAEDGRADERAPGEVFVSTFFMDRTEVTNGAYEASSRRAGATGSRSPGLRNEQPPCFA